MTHQLLAGGEVEAARKTFLTLPPEHSRHTQAVGDDHLVHLVRHGRIHELCPMFNFIFMFQPGQQIAHRDLTELTNEICRLSVDHELGQIDVYCIFCPPVWPRTGTSLYHSSSFSDGFPLFPLVTRFRKRLPNYVW